MDVSAEIMEPYTAAAVTDDACATQFIATVPVTADTDDTLTEEYDSVDSSAEVKQEILHQIKLEPDDVPVHVCDIVLVMKYLMYDSCHEFILLLTAIFQINLD